MTSVPPARRSRDPESDHRRVARDGARPLDRDHTDAPIPRPEDALAGADGCRGGWVIATREGAWTVPRLGAELPRFRHLGIDMPIGLPARPGRAADRAGRAFLGPRRSSIFPAPARALLHHATYEAANAASRDLFGCGLPIQAFHLLPKIREVDELLGSLPPDERATRVLEVHPECSFRALTGEVLPPKRSHDGVEARRRAVIREFGDLGAVPRGAAIDDLLDAYAVLWTVERFARGDHQVLPPDDPTAVDELGIVMRIVV